MSAMWWSASSPTGAQRLVDAALVAAGAGGRERVAVRADQPQPRPAVVALQHPARRVAPQRLLGAPAQGAHRVAGGAGQRPHPELLRRVGDRLVLLVLDPPDQLGRAGRRARHVLPVRADPGQVVQQVPPAWPGQPQPAVLLRLVRVEDDLLAAGHVADELRVRRHRQVRETGRHELRDEVVGARAEAGAEHHGARPGSAPAAGPGRAARARRAPRSPMGPPPASAARTPRPRRSPRRCATGPDRSGRAGARRRRSGSRSRTGASRRDGRRPGPPTAPWSSGCRGGSPRWPGSGAASRRPGRQRTGSSVAPGSSRDRAAAARTAAARAGRCRRHCPRRSGHSAQVKRSRWISGEQTVASRRKCRMSHMPTSPSESRRDAEARRARRVPAGARAAVRSGLRQPHPPRPTIWRGRACPVDRPATRSPALIAAAAKAGVDRLVQVGVDVPSSRWGADLADPARGGRWPPSRCTRTRRPDCPTWTRRCARSRRWPPSRGCAASARPGWTRSAPASDGRARAGGELPGAHRDRQAARQGAGHPRPGRARRHAAGARRGGRAGHGGHALLLRRRRVRRRVRAARLHLSFAGTVTFASAGAPARGGRDHPGRTSSWWRPTRRT